MSAAAPSGTADSPAGVLKVDALVIGAGPVGLWQVFQLGLQGIAAHVVDALPVPGGQCIELYPDKPIYDIPGIPVSTGRELVDRLLQQIRPFSPVFHLGQTVDSLAPHDDGCFAVTTSAGQHLMARCVFIAAGVGAFLPRQLKLPEAERHQGHQLFYQPPGTGLADQQVVVVGGDDAALQAVIDLAGLAAADRPASLVLLHRRATLQAEPARLRQWQALLSQGAVRFQTGQILALEAAETPAAPLAALQLIGDDNTQYRLPVDRLLVMLGLSPKLGPIAQWGLALQRRQLVVDAAHFETSTPGIYAVGDVVSYPGKKKLILCGFHEATLATFAALQHLRPDEPTLLQYTTTSSRLQQRLGVVVDATGLTTAADPAD